MKLLVWIECILGIFEDGCAEILILQSRRGDRRALMMDRGICLLRHYAELVRFVRRVLSTRLVKGNGFAKGGERVAPTLCSLILMTMSTAKTK
jgi:ABC-type uncharacterized transport system ATPase component